MRRILFLLWIVSLLSCTKATQQTDSFNEDAILKSFPQIKEWQKAGVRNLEGVEVLSEYSASIDDDLQEKIDSIAFLGGGKIILEPGRYILSKSLIMRDNIYLEGVDKETVVLEGKSQASFEPSPEKTPCIIEFNSLKGSGLSNLTLTYTAADFLPIDHEEFYHSWDKNAFKNDPQGDTTLYVGLIGIKNAEDILVNNCQLLNAGTDPIIIAQSKHVSVLNTLVKGSYNKGGKGNGYFNIDANSSHVLVKHCYVQKIRHLAIQNGAEYNVIYDNYFEVDVNFHNGDSGNNLVENNIIRIPEWHGWHCFSSGAKSLHRPPGPNNYLLNNFTQYKLPIPNIRPFTTEYGDSVLYKTMTPIDTLIIKNNPMVRWEYGALDLEKMKSSNQLYQMNPTWDDRKRVLPVDLDKPITTLYRYEPK